MMRRVAAMAAVQSGSGAALAAPETLPPFSPDEPRHRGATGYPGELFLQRGGAESARGQLARHDAPCPPGCAGRDDLAAAIADFEAAATRAAEPAR